MSVKDRIRRLQATSPFYAQQLRQHPDWIDWLDKPKNRDCEYRYSALEDIWRRKHGGDNFDLDQLRQFRRRISVRIAYRELNGLADVEESWRELSRLAQFVLGRLCAWRWQTLTAEIGEPLCAETGRLARYCVFALGKLGAEELNFCSDLDLVFCIEGNGHCRKDDRETPLTTREFYDRFFRQIATDLTTVTPAGFLYHLDLRLRPEGDSGPLARTADSLVNYYWERGQTWERLAWLRGRVVAGDAALGQDVLEEIHPFRYPQYPPHNVLTEVAGVKLRTESEVPPGELARDIKTGPGGIREIEFIAQALQLTHGGRNPFLQTHSTIAALSQLARYGILDGEEACFLSRAYQWLRRLENRLQMRGETPRHCLPASTDERLWLVESMGAADWDAFAVELDAWRVGVRQRYCAHFPEDPQEANIQAWTLFFSGQPPAPEIAAQLEAWFPEGSEVERRLRSFVLGGASTSITRDAVLRFLDLAPHLDHILPRLARPLQTLERIGRFAEHYGARRQFFRHSANPALFTSLSLLFDRSTYIYELLCRRPGMMEELLREAPRRLRTRDECRAEMALLREGEGDYADRLWLYVKAEQVRLTIAELLHGVSLEAVGWALTQLAEAAIQETLEAAGVGDLTVIALGKFGAEELTLGSDLDLLLISERRLSEESAERLRAWRRLITHRTTLGPMYAVDLRLRPHGRVGPLAVTLPALEDYHTRGAAKPWEKQILVRARPVAGPYYRQVAFVQWRDQLLYAQPMPEQDLAEMWRMRRVIEQEKRPTGQPPECAFKTGPGGLLDLEFLAELLSLRYGFEEPELRQAHAHTCLLAAASKGILPQEMADRLLANWRALRRIEFDLRRVDFLPVVELPEDELIAKTLVRWLGWADVEDFWNRYRKNLSENRDALSQWLEPRLARGLDAQASHP